MEKNAIRHHHIVISKRLTNAKDADKSENPNLEGSIEIMNSL